MVLLTDIQRFFRGTMKLSEPLAKYTALRVGGSADYFLEPHSREDVTELQKYLQEHAFPYVMITPNMLVNDKGFRGAAIYFSRNGDMANAGKGRAIMFKEPPGISVAGLVEKAGMNGRTLGGATVVGDRIVNTNNATAGEILSLVNAVRQAIDEKCGIRLEIDLQLVGFEENVPGRNS